VEGIVVDNAAFRSGDTCDQILKLSENAPNSGRFLLSKILGVRAPKSSNQIVIPASRHVTQKRRFLSLVPKLLLLIR